MFCPNCRNELPDWATFCNKCGEKIATVDIIVPDEKKKPSKTKMIFIASAVAIVLAVLISSIVVLLTQNEGKDTGQSVSIRTSSLEKVESTQSFDDNQTKIIYIRWDVDSRNNKYYNRCVIHRDGDIIVSLEHSIGTNSSEYMGSDEFSQEQCDKWVKDYTEFFESKNLDAKYVRTEIYSNSDERSATVIVPDMKSVESQEYFERLQVIPYYRAGMTFSEFEKSLTRDGYRRKQ